MNHLQPDECHAVHFLDAQIHRFVIQHEMARHRSQRFAQGGLIAQGNRQWPEIVQLARFAHAQAEVFDTASLGRVLQQAHHRLRRDLVVRIQQCRCAEADFAQLTIGVQANCAGNVDKICQA
ncbi:hypothetical protein D9M73_214020 [compost metagenome]